MKVEVAKIQFTLGISDSFSNGLVIRIFQRLCDIYDYSAIL